MAIIDDEFINNNPPEFTLIDGKSSIKTNLLLFSRNWKNLNQYLLNLVIYLRALRNLIDVDKLIQDIIETFQKSKTSVPVLFTMNIGEIQNTEVNSVVYKVQRINEYIVEITNLTVSNWIVDKLMVQIKNSEGSIVYPLIITKNNKITIHFIDGLTSNYDVIFI